jgi:prepilin-type N-terminal cleavage/methylation domain-containing protein
MRIRFSNNLTHRLQAAGAFTLIELLAVISIMALIAALVGPTVKQLRRGDTIQTATREMLDAVARARQLAISEHTTVYMVFVPTNFWLDPAYQGLTLADRNAANNLLDKQLTGYNFVSLRSVGDQPGQGVPRYLSPWQTLPDGTFIAIDKFSIPRNTYYTVGGLLPPVQRFRVFGFDVVTNIPFPLAETLPNTVLPARPWPGLPCIAFDYMGRLVSDRDEFIPLAQGGVVPVLGLNKLPFMPAPPTGPSVRESPPGNSTNSYNLIHIDRLTGRARVERREIQ